MSERVPPDPPPRYDETFHRGTVWLDSMAEPEEPLLDQMMRDASWRLRLLCWWERFRLRVEELPFGLWIIDAPMQDGFRYRSRRPNPPDTQF